MTKLDDRFYTVPELAKDLGITPRTIRFYEQKGLVNPQRAGTTRVYTRQDRAKLLIILRGKRLGFSLNEIADYLDLYGADPTQAEQIKMLLRRVRGRISDLEEQRQALDVTLDELRDIEQQSIDALEEKGINPDS
ncbi:MULTISPECIES: MerR family DNA-binding transcriptional regulator [Thalassospira]|jgi:DNA-binding transcriptional MerR regulator|uniref:MerR family DNA-binding transcriptional regulator n=1 Tax=Thalassospira povalilytica TaxID=732237 RepID=A0A8I1M529_9PROT|nr:MULTISPECIES: MerR family DNA-binding transcriptional regulator [Thalassospira]MEE3047414.1 MerR family DNA-binding transcriptional regulator [Pseudomonadota bacterium]RCK27962.1 MerR family transcriptional regulator [Thalassospira profundimaris]MAL41720.1 MerR family transcriptional regulator [Thalassospira sp.]MBN8195410.1 MerR family DNA-binding transcriptional regulator [Thalassospira povalilytica]MBO6770253.1 MerR family DNA-binding transcriptional regulator [Thalassospira sp.]|tara:strand:- start:225 stop:629 length:405 start_codon:yes stop_codon:yes gene_type:complete